MISDLELTKKSLETQFASALERVGVLEQQVEQFKNANSKVNTTGKSQDDSRRLEFVSP